jgi:hypothetical protein
MHVLTAQIGGAAERLLRKSILLCWRYFVLVVYLLRTCIIDLNISEKKRMSRLHRVALTEHQKTNAVTRTQDDILTQSSSRKKLIAVCPYPCTSRLPLIRIYVTCLRIWTGRPDLFIQDKEAGKVHSDAL